jgi:hypothetical protein
MTTKTKAPKLFIRGVARFPKTDKAYSYSKEQKKSIPDPKGKLSVEVIVSAEAARRFQTQIEDYAKSEGLKKPKNWPFSAEVDKDTDEETGNVIFKAWQYGQSKDGAPRRMGHFDSRGKPLPSSFRLTSGSEIIIGVRPNAYKELGGGVNLYLDGVQVVRYREFDGNPGFGVVEDGDFQADDEDNASDFADASGAEGDAPSGEPTDF